jgi:hypothetical protein
MQTPAVKTADVEFGSQLTTFKDNIGSYSTLGVTPAQVTAQAADADYFNYVLECQAVIQNDALEWTAWKRLARRGKGAATPHRRCRRQCRRLRPGSKHAFAA